MLQPKDAGWLNGYKKKTHINAAYKRPTSDLEIHTNKKQKDGKFYVNGKQKKARVAIVISDKIDFKNIIRDKGG